MNLKAAKFWKKSRPWVIAAVAMIWAIYMAQALRTLPSAEDASKHLAEMKDDLEHALNGNGWVTKATNNSKYGGALAYRLINGSTIDLEKKSVIRRRLAELGWRPMKGSTEEYCKHEMLLTFRDDQGISDGKSNSFLSVEFNPSTVKRCSL